PELALLVDDGGDERGIQVLEPRLLADDVLVSERQRQLLQGLLARPEPEHEAAGQRSEHEQRDTAPAADGRAEAATAPPLGARRVRRVARVGRGLAQAPILRSTSDNSRSNSSTLPSF